MSLFKRDNNEKKHNKVKKEKKLDIIVCEKCGFYYNPNEHEQCPKCKQEKKEKSVADISVTDNYEAEDENEKEIKRVDVIENEPKTLGWANIQGRDIEKFITLKKDNTVIDKVSVTEKSNADIENHENVDIQEEPKTVGIYGGFNQNVSNNSEINDEGTFEDEKFIEPVVGWVVCVQGNNRGKSYELKSGFNYVGRSRQMDISLNGDEQVSREKHMSIIYDYKNKSFLACMGENSKNVVYLNDKLLLGNPSELKPYDLIEIGSSKLVFIPFCSEQFSWN